MPDLDFYTGAYTGQQIDQRLGKMVVVVSGTITANNKQITNANILANHVVVNAVLSNPTAQASNWTVQTYAGYLTITGDVSGSTTLTLTLGLT
ncbi:MAG: hypothetical protein II008_06100 [Oscillospiraceae bacterium]|nr:hypothetical protein [Oscillospiraceae bacterium]